MTDDTIRYIGGRSPAEVGAAYQYQGRRTNDCGPFSLAMVINLQLGENRVSGDELGDLMQAKSWGFGLIRYRFTSWMGKRQGATSPWGLVMAYREFGPPLAGVGPGRLGRMRWRVAGARDRLLDNLARGVLSTLLLVWQGANSAHFATVVGYDAESDRFLMLDSATGGDKSGLPAEERLLAVPWEKLDSDWSRRAWWFLWLNRVMIETHML